MCRSRQVDLGFESSGRLHTHTHQQNVKSPNDNKVKRESYSPQALLLTHKLQMITCRMWTIIEVRCLTTCATSEYFVAVAPSRHSSYRVRSLETGNSLTSFMQCCSAPSDALWFPIPKSLASPAPKYLMKADAWPLLDLRMKSVKDHRDI